MHKIKTFLLMFLAFVVVAPIAVLGYSYSSYAPGTSKVVLPDGGIIDPNANEESMDGSATTTLSQLFSGGSSSTFIANIGADGFTFGPCVQASSTASRLVYTLYFAYDTSANPTWRVETDAVGVSYGSVTHTPLTHTLDVSGAVSAPGVCYDILTANSKRARQVKIVTSASGANLIINRWVK